jgi:hypothetical protein
MSHSWWHSLLSRTAGASSELEVGFRSNDNLEMPPAQPGTIEFIRPEPGRVEQSFRKADACRRVEVTFSHLVEVNRATECLLQQFHCDSWHVACQHEAQPVIRMMRSSVIRYAVCYECRPAVEKAIYHGSRAWALSIIPLNRKDNLTAEQLASLKSALDNLPSDY